VQFCGPNFAVIKGQLNKIAKRVTKIIEPRPSIGVRFGGIGEVVKGTTKNVTASTVGTGTTIRATSVIDL